MNMNDNKALILAEVLAKACTMGDGCPLNGCCPIDRYCEEVTHQHWLDYADRKVKEAENAE